MSPARRLIERHRAVAREVAHRALSPYSGFKVGAVIEMPDGTVHVGCNVESASYGLTQCAERNALGGAIAAGARRGAARAMLIYLSGERALPPCGACRQVMLELMDPEALIVSCCDGEHHLAWSLGELLPQPFLPETE